MKKSPLMEEMQMTQPFDPPELELHFNIIKTYEELQEQYGDFFKQFDLSLSQYNVLRILYGADNDGLTCQSISKRLVHRVPDVTRLVNRLTEKKLVQRKKCDHDRRVVWVSLTDEGRKLVKQMMEPLKQLTLTIFKPVSNNEQDKANEVLYKIRRKK